MFCGCYLRYGSLIVVLHYVLWVFWMALQCHISHDGPYYTGDASSSCRPMLTPILPEINLIDRSIYPEHAAY